MQGHMKALESTVYIIQAFKHLKRKHMNYINHHFFEIQNTIMSKFMVVSLYLQIMV